MDKNSKGLLIVISGPSGVGKGTVNRKLLKDNPQVVFSVSVTTRSKRENEVDGKEYFFRSEEEFSQMIKDGEFLEYMRVFGMFSYGTPRAFVNEQLNAGNDVILEIDVQGGLRVKEVCEDAVLIFLAPPSMEELKARLVERGTEDEHSIERRTEVAKDEMRCISYYDYVVVNSSIGQAVKGIEAIIHAEKSRVKRSSDLITLLLEGCDNIC
ncbi:MAG TPA: guanylate kinase [Clostridia bacterium]|nr:guanylate kinase [Clostridia bacterium]